MKASAGSTRATQSPSQTPHRGETPQGRNSTSTRGNPPANIYYSYIAYRIYSNSNQTLTLTTNYKYTIHPRYPVSDM